ncbi:MAG: hypothetical protein AAF401_18400, partial [Pseudomonadota bacterium]
VVTILIAVFIGGLSLAWLFAGKKRSKSVSRLEELRLAGRDAAAPVAKAQAAQPAAAAAPTPVESLATPLADNVESLPPLEAAKPPKAEEAPKPKSAEHASAMSIAAALVRHDKRPPEPREAKPSCLKAPRGGVPDDLTRIRGIGARLESQLNAMGYHHIDQIAGWSEEEVKWIDDHLDGFRGRATRDQWVSQARALIASGENQAMPRVSQLH